jgi:hypothetical protein
MASALRAPRGLFLPKNPLTIRGRENLKRFWIVRLKGRVMQFLDPLLFL